MPTIRSVAVVIPARNEELRLSACLSALTLCRQRLAVSDPAIRVLITVVLDRCVDRSAAVVASWSDVMGPDVMGPDVMSIESSAGQVGASRDLGVRRSLATLAVAGHDAPRQTWIACTDADSTVPADWLTGQLRLAAGGAQMILGTVIPGVDGTGEPADSALAAWHAEHPLSEGHPYVHGANLGIRADTYLAAGGFAHVCEHEDVLLAESVRAAGARVVSTARYPVVTSARRHGRSPGGFAGYLRLLDERLPAIA